ncbi:unnamed protein product [Prunus armeniaca]|uniref:FMN-dependent dehydrogenase domain-containing protein n=1 Tax=Prunus armeniaca TaxID=36596 RepID=A0A6J5U784_PRUAR|nr:unnamed protein product [Prunus armeniaca]
MLLQVGRPVIYGLAANGERGVRRVIEMVKDEFELTMALCGCPGVMYPKPNYKHIARTSSQTKLYGHN